MTFCHFSWCFLKDLYLTQGSLRSCVSVPKTKRAWEERGHLICHLHTYHRTLWGKCLPSQINNMQKEKLLSGSHLGTLIDYVLSNVLALETLVEKNRQTRLTHPNVSIQSTSSWLVLQPERSYCISPVVTWNCPLLFSAFRPAPPTPLATDCLVSKDAAVSTAAWGLHTQLQNSAHQAL